MFATEPIIVQRKKEVLSTYPKSQLVDEIIADLSFGFWTTLLDAKYEQKLWRTKIMRIAFPYLEKAHRTRKHISRVFYKIRLLRNRIFHHEPIWHLHDLISQHDSIVAAIGWMDPQMLSLVEPDRFKAIYLAGPELYKK